MDGEEDKFEENKIEEVGRKRGRSN